MAEETVSLLQKSEESKDHASLDRRLMSPRRRQRRGSLTDIPGEIQVRRTVKNSQNGIEVWFQLIKVGLCSSVATDVR